MNSSQRRRAENELIFKQRNDAIKDMAKEVFAGEFDPNATLKFTCECANEKCRDTIEMPVKEYEKARKNSREFIIKPGHEQNDIEKVVRHEGYSMVEKFQVPSSTDGRLNPT